MSQYLDIFIEESKEHLQGLNQCLLLLEQTPGDTSPLNEIFRVAHTLKGMSGTMGFNKMATLTHDMENVLHALRNNEIKVSSKLIDVLFECLDALGTYVDAVVNTGNEGSKDYSNIISSLNDILNNKSGESEITEKISVEDIKIESKAVQLSNSTSEIQLNQYDQNVINKANEMGMNVFKITLVLNKGCLLKSARSFIIFQTLERYSEIIKSNPKVEDIEDERFDYDFTVVVISKESESLFTKELNSIAEVDEVIISILKSKPIEGAVINSSPTDIIQNIAETINEEAAKTDKESSAADQSGQASKKSKTGKTVRVDIDRLDVLMNLVSELIIQKTRLGGIDNMDRTQVFGEALESLERVTTDLHDAVMKVRMVPVETVFNRFPRLIRDLSKDLGKEINLVMSGEETELDRTVIDEIGDPLIHLLRNSIDHGIESAGKRKEQGKPIVGKIDLKAYQDGNNVIIEVCDDGNGINADAVKKKAIERGILNKDLANNLSQKDIIDYLFRPSFSMADKITDISGRGVGLDVVKTKIEALGGAVEVTTEMGKGSKFIIRLPLTLAIIQALLVYVGEEKFAIPLSSIHSIESITPNDIKLVQKQEVMLLRKMVIPIVRLNKVLDAKTNGVEHKQLKVVIVKKGEKLSGFAVDSLIGQQEIVIKSLGKLLLGIKLIAGATILGDGNVALIIDVNSLAL